MWSTEDAVISQRDAKSIPSFASGDYPDIFIQMTSNSRFSAPKQQNTARIEISKASIKYEGITSLGTKLSFMR
jgi:hypothetical protein